MADQITAFNQIKDASNNIVQYDVSYSVDDGSGHSNQFCITITASEMTDATDVAEAKTKANTRATAMKSAWIAALPVITVTDQPTQVGSVTL